MSEASPPAPFFLVIIDHARGFFSVEGPMTDDQPWQAATHRARDRGRQVGCGPTGPDRDALATEFQGTKKLAMVPPGSIVRPNR
jgi:hypothetical protein